MWKFGGIKIERTPFRYFFFCRCTEIGVKVIETLCSYALRIQKIDMVRVPGPLFPSYSGSKGDNRLKMSHMLKKSTLNESHSSWTIFGYSMTTLKFGGLCGRSGTIN